MGGPGSHERAGSVRRDTGPSADLPARRCYAFGMLARIIAYVWASPNTALGLLFAPVAFASGGTVRLVTGVVEIEGRAIAWALEHLVPLSTGAEALTLGHVVLGRSVESLDLTRPHERVHVRQYERWGPLFIPAYFGSSLVAMLRGQDPYMANRFEREAYGAEE